MVQNHHLAKSINDAGWSQLMQFTKYKAEYAGKRNQVSAILIENRPSISTVGTTGINARQGFAQ